MTWACRRYNRIKPDGEASGLYPVADRNFAIAIGSQRRTVGALEFAAVGRRIKPGDYLIFYSQQSIVG